MSEAGTVLVIGYGNPGRLDDGLGPALADALSEMGLPDVTVEADYQLTVEDASDVAAHDVVVFADASVDGPEPFSFRQVEPQSGISFSSHSADAGAVLALAGELFGAGTVGYTLGIRGYEFDEFGERLSPKAQENLAAAVWFIEPLLRRKAFRQAAAAGAARSDEDGTCKTENT